MSNPWGDVANAYGRDLDQLGAVQSQGYQQMGQMGNTIYDKFIKGYQMAKAQKQQEIELAMQQQNQQRQMMLAEETLRHNRTVETQRMKDEQDRMTRDARARATSAVASFNARIPGQRELLEPLLKEAGLSDIPLPSVSGSDTNIELPGPVAPGKRLMLQTEDRLSGLGPAAYEKEQDQIRAEGIAAEAARKNSVTEEDRKLAREQSAQQGAENRETRLLIASMAAGGRNAVVDERRARNEAKEAEKRDMAEARKRDAIDDLDALVSDLEQVKNHKGLDKYTGPIVGALYRKTPDGKVVTTRVDSAKGRIQLTTMSKLKALSPTGATGFGALSNAEGELLKNSVGSLDMDSPSFKEDLDKVIKRLKDARDKTAGVKSDNPGNQPTGDTVRVKHPDGRTGSIPRANLEKAKKNGWTEIP